jgi:hypothetical protein
MGIATAKVYSRRSPYGSIHSKIKVSRAYYSKMELLLITPASPTTIYKFRRLRRWLGQVTVQM